MQKQDYNGLVIGFAGPAGSGKDTAATHIKAELMKRHLGVAIRRFADSLKSSSAEILKVEVSDFEDQDFKKSDIPWIGITYREFLIKHGEFMRDKVHPDIWINSLIRGMIKDYLFDHADVIMITDLRYENELAFIRSFKNHTIFLCEDKSNPIPAITINEGKYGNSESLPKKIYGTPGVEMISKERGDFNYSKEAKFVFDKTYIFK